MMSIQKKVLSIVLSLLLISIMSSPVLAAPGINDQVSFQGKVVNTDGTNVSDGSYDMVFRLYSAASGGTLLWTEAFTGASQVDVENGIFQVYLGSTNSLPSSVNFNDDSLYLQITFSGEDMSPRIRFSAVPYALNAQKVGGLTVTNTTGTLTIPDGTTIAFNDSNDLTFYTLGDTQITLPTTGVVATLEGTETFANKTINGGLTFTNGSWAGLGASAGRIVFTDTTIDEVQVSNAKFKITNNGEALEIGDGTNTASDINFSGNRTMVGYDGSFAVLQGGPSKGIKFNVNNSSFGQGTVMTIDSVGNVGIGDTTPDALLEILGTTEQLRLSYTDGTQDSRFSVSSTGILTIDNTGTRTIIADGLQVNGTVWSNTFDRNTAGALTIGNSTATSVSICNSAACDTISIGTNTDTDTIQIGSSGDGLTIASSGLNLTSAGAVSGVSTFASTGDWTWTATTPTITVNSNETFSITDATNAFNFSLSTGPAFTGNARPSKKVTYSPEYNGGTLTTFYGAGTDTSTNGVMVADVETTGTNDQRTYYEWDSSQGSLQSYTVAIRMTLPEDFSGWENTAVIIDYATESTSSSNSALDAYLYLGSNSTTAITSSSNSVSLSTGLWTELSMSGAVLDDGTAPEWDAAGETATLYLRMRSQNNNYVRLGDITLQYKARF